MVRITTAFALVLVVTTSAMGSPISQGLAMLTQTFKALGGTLPVDSQASGTFNRVSGAVEDTGTVQTPDARAHSDCADDHRCPFTTL